ncbi:MAG: alpha/beta hydrolase [Gemmatimonadetes bacterium]|nr:alpha/beta hydrolase [Gemmatimonadota bacterium]
MTIRVSDFVLAQDAGEELRGEVRWPEGSSPDSAVVVVHGFKGFKDWGFFPHACQTLSEAGHAVVSFNFSHNGIGDDPEAFTELERFAGNTLSRELDEVGRVVSAVVAGELPGVDSGVKIGVLGHSRGGGQAVLATAEHEEVAALVTWSAVADFDRWGDDVKREWRTSGRIHVANARTGQQMPLDVTLLEDFERNTDRLDIGAAARAVEVPWLVVHGTDDGTVDPEEGRRLATLAGDGRLLLVAGAGHTFEARHPFVGSTPQLDQALAATREHFDRHLGD